MAKTIEEFIQKYNTVKSEAAFQFGGAQSFVTELLSQPPEIRYSLIPLFRKIQEDAFELGFNIPNLNLTSIGEEKVSWEASRAPKTAVKPESTYNEVDNFNDILFKFTLSHKPILESIKGYFIFRLDSGNTDLKSTEVIYLCDEDFKKHPKFIETVEGTGKDYLIRDFLGLLTKQPEDININYLCLLLITPNLRNPQILSPNLTDLFKLFPKSDYISVLNLPIKAQADFRLLPYNKGLELIDKYSSVVFNNKAISFEEEIIINRLFAEKEIILEYKLLKGGSSGSKVIEIRYIKDHTPSNRRFVIKYSKIKENKKLALEITAFNRHLRDLLVEGYQALYEETETHEAIRYSFASSDSIKDSYSFSELLKFHFEGNSPFNLNDTIKELFTETAPIKLWNGTKENKKESVKILYEKYLPTEDKILSTLAEIKGKKVNEIKTENFIKNYNKIINFNITTCKKICHGDLHTENFYKDEKGVYLIDFGWTDRLHAILDHAFLECSLRYNHIPRYIPINELIGLENKLLTIESFTKEFDISFINRKRLKEIFTLIIQIRENSKELLFNKSNSLEYLISLFVVSIKLMRYEDLNQSYAMELAELLGNKIVPLISAVNLTNAELISTTRIL